MTTIMIADATNLTREIVAQLLENTEDHLVIVEFINKDTLSIRLLTDSSAKYGRVRIVEVFYARPVQEQFVTTGQQLWHAKYLNGAIEAFLQRLWSGKPSDPFSTDYLSYTMEEIYAIDRLCNDQKPV